MIPTDCYRASVYFHGEQREFLHYCRELVYEGLANTLDPGTPERGPSPSPSTSSSGSTCEEHRVGPLKMVGWTGSAQLTCAICGDKVTTCCIECSNSTSVVALCKSEHINMKFDPDFPRSLLKNCWRSKSASVLTAKS